MNFGISNILFFVISYFSIHFFVKNISKVFRNINLGQPYNPNSNRNKKQKWSSIIKSIFGQSKMYSKPVSSIFHLIIFIGFIVVNIGLLEIFIDGIFGTNRSIGKLLNYPIYKYITCISEIFALLVIISAIIFLIRRNLLSIRRFSRKEINGWQRLDANLILLFEIILMISFFIMNSSSHEIMKSQNNIYGFFPISTFIFNFESLSISQLYITEKISWWVHIIGILFFLNYIYYSKHLHIITAFPNMFYYKPENLGYLENMKNVTLEVKSIFGIETDEENKITTETFGAKDIFDLNKKNLLEAYTCTECGRCTEVCPANISGRELSPRGIMMKTRDRLEEVGQNINKNKKFISDKKSLLGDYISRDEIWSCTTCMACIESCPLNINPMSIIIELRRYISMEEASSPRELNDMCTNIENNFSPWKLPHNDRDKWANN